MLHVGLGIHDPDLDGAEVGMGTHVVPEIRVVRDHARADHEIDPLLVVGPVLVGGGHAHARKGPEDRRARRGQAGRVSSPEGRIGRQRQEQGHVHAHPIGHVDRLFRVIEADVDVHPEDQLLASDEAQRRDEVSIARARHDALLLP